MNRLYVVGIGPGDLEEMIPAAKTVLQKADLIVGYKGYTDLITSAFPDKTVLSTGMTGEVARCRRAITEALSGKCVAVVSSGDAGVYGMAGLLYELSENVDIEIEVVPGITAALSGAARLGAPLANDFAVVSLSDRLTPFQTIEKRLRLLAEADMCIVLYNPASSQRPDYLMKACRILLEHKPQDTICGIARNIGRDGESTQIMSLSALAEYPADMFTTVFIGNSQTCLIHGKMVTRRGYLENGRMSTD